ncbi:MAG: hypothetical protein NVS1B5_08310 [Gemmatimonadaceae bacterium]
MPNSPQRPFVPHRTPKARLASSSTSEFRLYRPFVPGADRASIESLQFEMKSDARIQPGALLQPIDAFLDLSPGDSPRAGTESNGAELPSTFDEVPDELPPVEHFLDPLPAAEGFASLQSPAFEPPRSTGRLDTARSEAQGEALAPGWADTDWQQYDWRAAAGLRENGDTAASNAWATTNWDASLPRAKDDRPTAAQAIASALDEIAQRIRAGELAVPMPGSTTDPATIAATLAALLGIRR